LTEGDVPIVVARWLHFGSLAIAFGASLFSFYAVPGELRGRFSFEKATDRIVRLCAYLALASGILWMLSSIAEMADDPALLLDTSTLSDFFFETSFGPVWMLRLIVLAALAGLASGARRGRLAATRRGLVAVLAAAALASQAWLGHAAMASGGELGRELASYIVHVLAAGAWIGSLVPLTCLSDARGLDDASATLRAYSAILRRFSAVAVGLVLAILLTGVTNTAFRLASAQDLVATRYGHVVLVKACLFLAMLAIAAINRWRLLPRVECEGARAVRALRVNILAEQGLAALVLAAAAILGILPPQL
jgi:putative copper resistance protein D